MRQGPADRECLRSQVEVPYTGKKGLLKQPRYYFCLATDVRRGHPPPETDQPPLGPEIRGGVQLLPEVLPIPIPGQEFHPGVRPTPTRKPAVTYTLAAWPRSAYGTSFGATLTG